jgi:glyoxylase-like metal-dependent hydrolase (beta-lactamase superfamily II)
MIIRLRAMSELTIKPDNSARIMIKLFCLVVLLLTEPALYAQRPVAYEVYAIRFGKSGSLPLSAVAIGGSEKDSVADCYMFWLLKGGGKTILVDAGFELNENSGKEYSWSSANYIRPDSALLRLGLKPTEITDIIISHPHWDHIGGIGLFPSAQIWMQTDDYGYFVGTAWQKSGDHGGFYKPDVQAIVATNLEGRLHLINGDSIGILPGIRVFIGSRHTWESMYVLVSTRAEPVIIASDNSWYYYNLEHLTSIPPRFTFDTTAYVNQLKRMRRLQPDVSLIIPGHDALVFSKFPAVAQDVVRIR